MKYFIVSHFQPHSFSEIDATGHTVADHIELPFEIKRETYLVRAETQQLAFETFCSFLTIFSHPDCLIQRETDIVALATEPDPDWPASAVRIAEITDPLEIAQSIACF